MVLSLPKRLRRHRSEYVLALDESGQKAIRPSLERKSFFVGGIVVAAERLEDLREKWQRTWNAFDVNPSTEVKARDFERILAGWQDDEQARRRISQAFLTTMLDSVDALPLLVVVDKGEVGASLTVPTKRGGSAVNQPALLDFVAATYCSFLKRRKATGFLRADHLASSTEDSAFSDAWRAATQALQGEIAPEVDFVQSHSCPEVQLADVVIGVIRQQHEQNEPLIPGIARALRKAEEQGLYVFHVG